MQTPVFTWYYEVLLYYFHFENEEYYIASLSRLYSFRSGQQENMQQQKPA